jgi:hypothetical protein
MDRNILIKLFGTFTVLGLIIVLGKQLKSNPDLQEKIIYNPMYEENLAEVQKMQDEAELQIRLDNEQRALEYKNGR